jgi:hypothetical protein
MAQSGHFDIEFQCPLLGTPRRPICIPGHRDVINHDEHEEYYANHGENLKNIFMICHEIT